MDARSKTMPAIWAANASTNIPSPPLSGQAYRNVALTPANFEVGQQYSTIADSATWNQILWLISGLLQAAEQYGVMPYSPLTNYPENGLCLGLDGIVYQALKVNGPDTLNGVQDTNNDEYWRRLVPEEKKIEKYDICEFYYFRNPTLRAGFQPCQGGVLTNVDTLYPSTWDYLQTASGQLLTISEAQWQAMTVAQWGSGTNKASWGGIGGAPFFVLNTSARTLRLPDLRGMSMEASGDGLTVGAAHGDAVRNFPGVFSFESQVAGPTGTPTFTPPFSYHADYTRNHLVGAGGVGWNHEVLFDPSSATPTANRVQTRAWGALACVYLGEA